MENAILPKLAWLVTVVLSTKWNVAGLHGQILNKTWDITSDQQSLEATLELQHSFFFLNFLYPTFSPQTQRLDKEAITILQNLDSSISSLNNVFKMVHWTIAICRRAVVRITMN